LLISEGTVDFGTGFFSFERLFTLRRAHMANTYNAVTKKDGDWWIGWIEELPGVNCQERTHQELIETLEITLREALEFNREEARSAAKGEFQGELITI